MALEGEYDMQKQDKDLAARIAGGAKLAAGDALTPGYRAELMRLMVVLADSELAGAAGFCPYVNRGPGLRERIVAAKIVAEKYVHAELVLDLLKAFGVEPQLYVRSHAWDSRLDRNVDLGTRRIGGDKRLNVFHYPLEGWEDAVTFNMLMGMATAVQLAEMQDCSYTPLAGAIATLLSREREHAALGEAGVKQAIERTGSRSATQTAVDYWLPRVAATFGREDSAHADVYIQYGLRRRGNADMLADWRDQTEAALKRLGLKASF
ncbi:MAG: phenylacetate-CoA oxygenase subunit PaaI [Rhodocyclaceae bacterium]|nr:phenylacetate-CoA oxygenase subunit PaaI [Rhodocyclaceae bacterium]